MKVSFYSLGCKVNLYESEVIINMFKKRGYEIVNYEDKSDIIVINTCTVTNTSDKKSRNIIRKSTTFDLFVFPIKIFTPGIDNISSLLTWL